MIILFGYAYLRIARDPVGYRPLIHIGAAGKLAAFALAAGAWWAGAVPAGLPIVVAGDAVLASLFLHYLWRTRDLP
jgi:hypothetical protein